jgi:hypothetical protein
MQSFAFSRIRWFVVIVAASAVLAHAAQSDEPDSMGEAVYTSEGALKFPEHPERWITLGSSIGGRYAQGSFDPRNPGTIGIVQIPPDAYRALRDTGRYPDGTMLLLTFYEARSKSDPQLKGFVQGDIQGREMHVIDRKRFPEEGSAFFLFPGATSQVGARTPLGSECFQCHSQHGRLEATFAQFYPLIRDLTQTGGRKSPP